jgi:DnaJ like chaperone protein
LVYRANMLIDCSSPNVGGFAIRTCFNARTNGGKASHMAWKQIMQAVGLAEGGAARAFLGNLCTTLGLGRLTREGSASNSVAFTIAVISLCAKISKADGVSTKLEAEAFKRIYRVPPQEAANVERLYDLARQDVAGYEAYADQVATLLANEPKLKRDVFEALFHMATADGIFHSGEEEYLKTVAAHFGYSPDEYQAIRALFVLDTDDPYRVLGVNRELPNDELKAHYRRLVREYHPDSLMAHGVPEEFIEFADRKIKAINAAYDQIARERGL